MLGTKLRGRYYIFKELGVGGFGQTFLAKDCDFPGNPWCVVKQLKPQVKDPWILQTARRLFDLEASVLARIGNHPQIPQLKAHFEENEQFYLVQEFIEGNLLSKELKGNSPWSQERAIAFLEDILGVLKFIHDNQVIHRDLKPENIILRNSDHKLVLIDFGSVKKITTLGEEDREDSSFTVAIGTPAYMPLEQQGGKPSYSSDIYAIGKIVIQGLSGISPKRLAEDPDTGELLWRHFVNIDDPFAEILSRMVKWNPRDRYQSVVEVIDDLNAYFNKIQSPKVNNTYQKQQDGSYTINGIVHNLKQHPEISRIKKLLFCVCKHRWENNSSVLIKYRTKSLLQELYTREPDFISFQNSIQEVVNTLNKQKKYQIIADLIIDQVKYLYESSQPLGTDSYDNNDGVPSQFTGIQLGEHSEQHSSQNYTDINRKPNSDSVTISNNLKLKNEFNNLDKEEAVIVNVDSQVNSSQSQKNQENSDHTNCHFFDLRYEATRYTTPLRIKILLFSMLYYQISFNEQDWSLVRTHSLDNLLKKVIETFPTLAELETRLYATAKNLKEQEGLTQTVGAILQSLRPFYDT
ncbi:MAG: hypothetical protein BRC33_08520 [Cyanobacteria bacterium SW_9_44_58]|nr:MAG: hypothetical protein BRC33_08520 [Cyanobacteria bacterium SW_9_44_58]